MNVLQLYTDAEGLIRWRIKAPNGRIVGASSQGFTTKRGCWENLGRVHDALNRGMPVDESGVE